MEVILDCIDKNFYIKIPPSLPFPGWDEEAAQVEECTCSCYSDFLVSLLKSTNMTSEILSVLKRRFLTYHSCCEYHMYHIEQI